MATVTNNGINKTCDTFTATTSVITPIITAASGNVFVGSSGHSVMLRQFVDLLFSYSSDNLSYHTLTSLSGGLQLDDGYQSGSSSFSVAQVLSNNVTSLFDLTLASVSPNTDIILNSARNINLNPTSNVVVASGKQLQLAATTNQIQLGTTNTVTISSTAPSSSRTYTLPDSGANSSFVLTDGAQTINGVKTFTGANIFSADQTISGAKLLVSGVTSGNNFFEGRVTGDSAARVSFYSDSGVSGVMVGEGDGLGTYLRYDTLPGQLRVSQNQNGTGAGTINTVGGTVQANTFSNASGNISITPTGSNKVVIGAGGLNLPTSGGTPGALDYYETYTNTIALSGIWASSQNVTINITRVGKAVNVYLGGPSATANTAAAISAPAGSIPTRFLGANSGVWGSFFRQGFAVRDNGTDKLGSINIPADGSFGIYAAIAVGTFFAGSGASGFPDQPLAWSL